MYSILLQAQPAAEGTSNPIMSFLPLILIVVVCYFFMIRPQQKKAKELAKMRDALKKGDHVMTTGGLMAKVAEVKDDCIVLEIQEGVKASFDKAAIANITPNK